MNKMKLIGIGSTARVGKDLLAELLAKKFTENGVVVKKYALAYELKKDCEAFLKEKLNLDVWSNDTTVKNKFREFLVWYGKVKREESQGTYWTNLLQARILKDLHSVYTNEDNFVAIVTDIRYCDPIFPKDEVAWVKDTMGGLLINLDRKLPNGKFVEPANADEEKNSMRVRCAASYEMVWRTAPIEQLEEEYVNPLYKYILEKI